MSRADLVALGGLWAGRMLASIIPRHLDGWLVPAWLRLIARPTRLGASGTERIIRSAMALAHADVDVAAVARDYKAATRETWWLLVRAAASARVPVETSVRGLEHIERASCGGVVLWGMSFYGPLVVKIGLCEAGVRLVVLSDVGHGAPEPTTRVGLRFVGGFFQTAENRFLAERITIPLDPSLDYLWVISKRLAEGRVVYLAGDRRAPRRNTKLRVLGGDMMLARGAPGLAFQTGSMLLPVHVVRESPLRFTVVVHEPIDATRSKGRNRFVSEATRAYARLLEDCVLRDPAGWDWYRYPSLSSRSGDGTA